MKSLLTKSLFMKRLFTRNRATLGLVLLLVSAMGLMGCVETRYTIRQVDQHHGGVINTVETSGERVISLGPFYESSEYLGINYWHCLQEGEKLSCNRVCDDAWARMCSPSLRGAFGQVSKPDAGIVMARYFARSQGDWSPVVVEDSEEDYVDGESVDGDFVDGESAEAESVEAEEELLEESESGEEVTP